MALEVIEYKDLFGNKMKVEVLEYGEDIPIDQLRKLSTGAYTALLVVEYSPDGLFLVKKLSKLILKEMDFSGLVIESDEDHIRLIAYFPLEEWQKNKIYNLLAPMFGLASETKK